MRLCVPVPCFFGSDIAGGIRKVKELGYDAVEAYGWKNWDFESIKEALEETGVEFLSICTSEFRMTDPAYRTAWLDGLKESCEAANKIGAKMLITQVGQDTGAPREEQHAAIVETLIAAKSILETSGCTIMIEPLNTKVNHPGYFLWSAHEGFAIVREVNHSKVKVVYDTYHQQVMEGDIIRSVVENLDCIAHLHAAGHPGRIELQNGELNYQFVFDAIDKAGYTGACGLEYGPRMDKVESLKAARELYK